MRNVKSITIIILLAVGLLNCTAMAKSASTLLQEGLYAEEVEGNLDSAINIYEQIINDSSAQRSYVAQALYRQGMCYMKKQNEPQAREIFAKIVSDYGDQTDIVAKVQPLLEEISNTDPAALMPPSTLVYAELGSPGMQIEKILNMLKGTPFENPLAMMGGNQQGTPPGQMNPANMLSALMNPSMMAEFKKIRGFGLGITGIPQQDDPPAIAVLFPGKSDALRGMIQAALGMVGQPTESIEGMQCLALPGGAGAAFDENIVIVASPKANAAGQLVWSVKQYKSIIKEPTLATSNKSFTRISKKERQENVLTIWANLNQIYANLSKLFPECSMPQEMRMVDGMVDFQSLNDLITTLSLKDDGVALETNLSFMDGHNCFAYDMIRTPNLSKAGFEAVPAGAAGLVSFALGEPESAQAQAASRKIQSMTGLDIGREIFANIEQVTLFALPPEEAPAQVDTFLPPLATRFGLAITSHNPQQTRQLLTRLLSMANLITSEAAGEQPVTVAGQYQVALVNGQKLFCYMNQSSKTTVLSLNPGVVETSMAAVDTRSSVTSAGPLKAVLDQLSPTTSKLVLVNIGGVIRLAMDNMDLGSGEGADKARQLVTQLADACSQTTFELRTDEQIDNLNVLAAINRLPEINKIFVPMMQLSQIIEGQKAQQRTREKRAMVPANIAKTGAAPVIDGNIDECWNAAQRYELKNSLYEAPSSESDCSAFFKSLWDKDNLYFLIDVTDEDLRHDSDDFYQDDAVEIFLDPDNSKSDSYGDNDYQFYFRWDKSSPTTGEFSDKSNVGIQFTMKTSGGGYVTEVKIPWAQLKVQPKPGVSMGLDVHVNDDDGGGDRDTKLAWWGKQDNAWESPSNLGNAQLTGLIGWWKLDEAEGNTAADSSGNNITGTLMNGPKWQPSGGKIDGALELDGVDDYVNTNYATDLSTWTVAVWAKSPAAPSGEEPSGPVSREKNYQINWNHPTDEFRGAAGICIDGNWYGASFGELQPNTWYRLAATYDGENLKTYKNGQLVSTNSDPSGSADAEVETLKFGRHARDEYFFAGTIDDVRIYNYALPEDEIKALNK